MSANPIRVLVVDDSALMRKLIPQILAADKSIQVIGTAMDGNFGLKKIEELRPQVITLDLEMPGMGGLEMLKKIMSGHRIPVIVVSSHTTQGAAVTFKALSLGAFDFVAKPSDVSSRIQEIGSELIAKIKAATQSHAIPLESAPQGPGVRKNKSTADKAPARIVAIGISTGGPHTLERLLSRLPADLPATILVVQHMPEGFTDMFARRLDECCDLNVKEAQSGDLLRAGRVLVCPGNHHMRVRRMPLGDVTILGDDPRVNGHRPSADVLFRSVAEGFGRSAIGVIMTGMGDDGARGLGLIKAAGGVTLAQGEQSCVVFGMPRAAIECGNAMHVVELDEMAAFLAALCMPGASATGKSLGVGQL